MTTTVHTPTPFAALERVAKGLTAPNQLGAGWNVRGGVSRYPMSIALDIHSVRAA